jgi:hypothetical protein
MVKVDVKVKGDKHLGMKGVLSWTACLNKGYKKYRYGDRPDTTNSYSG